MNNASQRSSPPLPGSPILAPSALDLASLPFLFSRSPLALSFSLSVLPPLSLSLSLSLSARVAFRNLFVIKAAIYFTLIEKIGRLPLPATIYHDRTRSRPPLFFAFSPPQKIIMPRMYVPARCNCGTFPGLPRTSRLLNRECKWQLEIFGRDAKESRGIPGI